MLKKLYIVLTFTLIIQLVDAQQRPQYTQYVFNNFLLNPAVSGIENYTDVKLGYRSQWTGLEGAPVTSYFSINAPLGNNFTNGDAAGLDAGENPASRLYTQYYRAAEPHHGIGFMVVSDKAGPITQTNLNATYAYHLGITDKLNVSVGVSAGFNHIILNTSQLIVEDPSDPLINNLKGSQWRPDVGVGIWAYSSNYYFGVSAQQLLTQNFGLIDGATGPPTQSKATPHLLVTGGYKFLVTDDVALLPSALLKFIQPAPITFDINMKMSFRDRFWIGGSYRKDDSFAALAGFNLSSFINVGYSYDMTTSALRTVSNGSHEIVIGIMLNNRNKVTSPQHGW